MGPHEVHDELREIVDWFKRLLEREHRSVRSFILTKRRQGIPLPQNAIYEFLGATRLLDWKTTCLLASALGQTPELVRPMWNRAKQAMDAKEMTSEAATTWEALPALDTRLKELLISQRDTVDRFPYDLLEVHRPPLAEVYVELGVQPAMSGQPHETSTEAHRRKKELRSGIRFRQALLQHDHLFVTGGPGAGKTTLGRLLTQQIAKKWLGDKDEETPWCAEPVIGISISAADILTASSWGEMLANSSRASMLTTPLEPQIFARRPSGVRWLVVVDGLDEIPSPRDRARVLDTLAIRAEHGTPYRLVVTSRPLPQEELSPFQGRSVGFYTLSGFDDVQQITFAERWFSAQGVPSSAEATSAFLEQVQLAGLSELMRIPLLATITASFYSRAPTISLPKGRIELYERFLDELTDARRHRVDIRSRLRVRWEEVGCAAVADWVLTELDNLVLHLAQAELGPRAHELLTTAAEWVRENLPEGMKLREGMDRDLGHLLGNTSVMVFDGTLSFLHRSFAEFIAARHVADSISPEFPELADWVCQIEREAKRNYIFFVFAHWARKPENRVTTIVRTLLANGLTHKIMALRLVTAGVPLGAELESAVVDRLLGELLEKANRWSSSEDLKLFTELNEIHGNRHLAARLRSLAQNDGLSISVRAAAAAAYAHVSDLPGGIQLLYGLTDTDDPNGLSNLVSYLSELDASAIDVRVRLLERLLDRGDSWKRVWAMSELLELGVSKDVAGLAEQILSGSEQNGDLLDFAAEIWLKVEGESAIPAIDLAIRSREHTNEWAHAGIATLFFRAGAPAIAEPHAREVLLTSTDEEGIREVVEAWTEACGSAGASAVVDVLSNHSCWNWDDRPQTATLLLELGYPEDAVKLARIILQKPSSNRRISTQALEVLISVYGTSSTGEIILWLNEARIESYQLSYAMSRLARYDLKQAAIAFANRIIRDPTTTIEHFAEAADTLLELDSPEVVLQIMDSLHSRPAGNTPLAAALAPVMAKHKRADAAIKLCHAVLYDAGRTLGELRVAIESWISMAGREAIPKILALAEAVCSLSGDERSEIAEFLNNIGHVEPAIALWCKVCVEPSLSHKVRWNAVDRLLSVGAADIAASALKVALNGAKGDVEMRRLRQLLGWVEPEITAAPLSVLGPGGPELRVGFPPDDVVAT